MLQQYGNLIYKHHKYKNYFKIETSQKVLNLESKALNHLTLWGNYFAWKTVIHLKLAHKFESSHKLVSTWTDKMPTIYK